MASRTPASCLRILYLACFLSAALGITRPSPGECREEMAIAGLPGRAAAWLSAPPSGPRAGSPLRRFGVVAPGCLYRSGQPTNDGYAWLAAQGFRGVISLRKEHDDGEAQIRRLGMNYLYLPIKDDAAPTDEQARAFLHFVRDPENWPVLVHCQKGVGRTGVMAALARYAMDGWSMSHALREARRFRPFGFRMFGSQRRWLNRWKDRFAAGAFHPARSLPPLTAKTPPAD